MKYFIIISLLFLSHFNLNAQELNTTLLNSKNQPYLVGKINKAGLTSSNFNSWFSKNYSEYSPNTSIINKLKPLLNDYNIVLFMGTWCGDSKLEVPRFYKVLESANFSMEQLTAIALSREKGAYKKSPSQEEKGLNIHRVPTFIIYKNGIEVNRIVEHPKTTLEGDLLEIVTTNNYEANYPIVTKVGAILKSDGLSGLKKARKQLIKTYKNSETTWSHLNTLSYLMFQDNLKEEALEVALLNVKLFPENAKALQNLATKYLALDKTRKAKRHFKKSLKLNPENEAIIKILETL